MNYFEEEVNDGHPETSNMEPIFPTCEVGIIVGVPDGKIDKDEPNNVNSERY